MSKLQERPHFPSNFPALFLPVLHTATTVLLDEVIFTQMGVKNSIRESEFQSS